MLSNQNQVSYNDFFSVTNGIGSNAILRNAGITHQGLYRGVHKTNFVSYWLTRKFHRVALESEEAI